MSAPRESAKFEGGEARVWLNGRTNVIVQLRESDTEGWADAVTWGFVSLDDWRAFLLACLRFDDELKGAGA
jgi:hypothetical protein